MILFFWFALSLLLGIAGSKRNIGGGWAFFLSLLLSPLIGLIIVLLSDKIDASSTPLSDEVKTLLERAKTKYKAKNYDEALYDFQTVLTLHPKAPESNYFIASIYSIKGNRDMAYKHLSMAVAEGFNDFELIQNDPNLKFLREQPDFREYAINGYKSTSSNP